MLKVTLEIVSTDPYEDTTQTQDMLWSSLAMPRAGDVIEHESGVYEVIKLIWTPFREDHDIWMKVQRV